MKNNGNENFQIGIPQFAQDALKNMLDEPTKGVGSSIRDLWDIVIGNRADYYAKKGKMYYALKISEYASEINQDLQKISNSNRKEPDIQILGNTLEDSKFCLDNVEIRHFFAKLVAATCDKTKSEMLNPGFSSIIRQLSSDDAILLRHIYSLKEDECNKFPVVDIRKIDEDQVVECQTGSTILKMVCDEKITSIKSQQTLLQLSVGIRAYENISTIGYDANCHYPENISSVLENLERLRLISIREREIVSRANPYKIIEDSDYVYKLLQECPLNVSGMKNFYFFEKNYFCLTQFGMDFMSVCS